MLILNMIVPLNPESSVFYEQLVT